MGWITVKGPDGKNCLAHTSQIKPPQGGSGLVRPGVCPGCGTNDAEPCLDNCHERRRRLAEAADPRRTPDAARRLLDECPALAADATFMACLYRLRTREWSAEEFLAQVGLAFFRQKEQALARLLEYLQQTRAVFVANGCGG